MKDTKNKTLIRGPPKLKCHTPEDCDGKIIKNYQVFRNAEYKHRVTDTFQTTSQA